MSEETSVLEIYDTLKIILAHIEKLLYFTEHGLTAPMIRVLSLLYKEDNLRSTEIAKRLSVTGGLVTWICDELIEKDLVQRTVPSNDRRARIISLTEKGEKLRLEINRHISEIDISLEGFRTEWTDNS